MCGLDFGITVDTLENFYEMPTADHIYLLDEFDHMLLNQSYKVVDKKLQGLWNFAKRNVIAFTATSSPTVERFASNIIGQPTVLKFLSSYELAHGTSPV